jgi:hypothetical protein
VREDLLPGTVFSMGFYIQPLSSLILEFDFSGSRDWDMKDISSFEEVKKEDGREKESTRTRNYDLNFGMSISYKI